MEEGSKDRKFYLKDISKREKGRTTMQYVSFMVHSIANISKNIKKL